MAKLLGVAGRLKSSGIKPTIMLSEFQKGGFHGLVGQRKRRSLWCHMRKDVPHGERQPAVNPPAASSQSQSGQESRGRRGRGASQDSADRSRVTARPE